MQPAISDFELLRVKPEASFGVVSTTGNYYNLRITDESLEYSLATAESQEYTGDGQTPDVIVVGANNSGTISYEPSYGEHDWMQEAALRTTVSNVVGTNGEGVGTGTFTATGLTVAGAGTPFAAVESGQYIRVVNAATAGNNKTVQVTGVVGGTGITVASGVFAPETGTTGLKVQGARFKNGMTLKTFTFERFNPELGATGMFEPLRGNAIDQWSIDMAPGSILGGQYTIVGKDALAMSTGTVLPGTGVASLTNQVMNAVTNFSNLLINGQPLSALNTVARKMQLRIKNNIGQRGGLGVLGPFGLRLGTIDVEVDFEIYLTDGTLYNYFITNTAVPVTWQFNDVLGNTYVVTLPRSKITSARRPAGKKGNDIVVSGTFDGLKDPVTGKSIIIDRCGSAITPWS
jgi:hypothetical protein